MHNLALITILKERKKTRKAIFKSAIKLYQKALDLDPNNVEILEKIFFAKSNTGQYSSAIDNLNTLIELKPQSSKYYFFRGFFHFNLKNYNAAILNYTKAIESQEDKIPISISIPKEVCVKCV